MQGPEAVAGAFISMRGKPWRVWREGSPEVTGFGGGQTPGGRSGSRRPGWRFVPCERMSSEKALRQVWSDRRESSGDTGHFDGRCKAKAGDVDKCPVVRASTGILGAWRGVPLASAPRGEVTADSGPFIPRARLASPPSFAARDSTRSDIRPPLSRLSICLGTSPQLARFTLGCSESRGSVLLLCWEGN